MPLSVYISRDGPTHHTTACSLPGLCVVELGATQVAAVAPLAALQRLRELGLGATRVRCLEPLRACQRLRVIRMN